MNTAWSDPDLALRLDDILYAAVEVVHAAVRCEDVDDGLWMLARALDALPLTERERYGV